MGRKQREADSLLRRENYPALKDMLSTWLPTEAADYISSVRPREQAYLFKMLPDPMELLVFEALPPRLQRKLILTFDEDQLKEVINHMADQRRAELFYQLPEDYVTKLTDLLEPEKRTAAQGHFGYKEESVGRIMTSDYLSVKKDWTLKETEDYMRAHGKNDSAFSILFVVDEEGNLIDDLFTREVMLGNPEQKIEELLDGKYVSLSVSDHESEALSLIRYSNHLVLPVTDNGKLVGAVTVEDALRIAKESDTEDIQMIGGTSALDEPYLHARLPLLIRKRAGWLVILFLSEMLTATAMGFFQKEISKAVVLALFIPLIISSGGNSGSQASTLVIRALALGEVRLRDWWRIIRREVISGLVLGILLGTIGFLRITIWSLFWKIYGPHWVLVALTVFFALIGVILWGTIAGSMLPLILKKFGADPATSSAPFIATLVDVTGLVIYFSVGYLVMRGTML